MGIPLKCCGALIAGLVATQAAQAQSSSDRGIVLPPIDVLGSNASSRITARSFVGMRK